MCKRFIVFGCQTFPIWTGLKTTQKNKKVFKTVDLWADVLLWHVQCFLHGRCFLYSWWLFFFFFLTNFGLITWSAVTCDKSSCLKLWRIIVYKAKIYAKDLRGKPAKNTCHFFVLDITGQGDVTSHFQTLFLEISPTCPPPTSRFFSSWNLFIHLKIQVHLLPVLFTWLFCSSEFPS